MPTDEFYDRMRRDFEDLQVEKRVRFLIEASASILAKGIEEAGRALADGLESRHSSGRADWPASGDETDGPGPAERETAQRQASTNESSSEQ
ncbi:MAG: hypothetical protein ABEL51_09415 [Salinibacter sp.]